MNGRWMRNLLVWQSGFLQRTWSSQSNNSVTSSRGRSSGYLFWILSLTRHSATTMCLPSLRVHGLSSGLCSCCRSQMIPGPMVRSHRKIYRARYGEDPCLDPLYRIEKYLGAAWGELQASNHSRAYGTASVPSSAGQLWWSPSACTSWPGQPVGLTPNTKSSVWYLQWYFCLYKSDRGRDWMVKTDFRRNRFCIIACGICIFGRQVCAVIQVYNVHEMIL